MGYSECVLDATVGFKSGTFCFCPIQGDIQGDFTIITGLNYFGALTPEGMKLVAVVHQDGQEASESFCQIYEDEIAVIRETCM